MSLRKILNKKIRKKGYITYDEMEQICKKHQYKTETGRRALEKDKSPNVIHVKATSKRGSEYIKGYKWDGDDGLTTQEKLDFGAELKSNDIARLCQ